MIRSSTSHNSKLAGTTLTPSGSSTVGTITGPLLLPPSGITTFTKSPSVWDELAGGGAERLSGAAGVGLAGALDAVLVLNKRWFEGPGTARASVSQPDAPVAAPASETGTAASIFDGRGGREGSRDLETGWRERRAGLR